MKIHPTAIIEDGVQIGSGTAIWDSAHIRIDACIGEHCIIGEKTYIGPGVRIGSHVKINTAVYICSGVSIEDHCFIAAHVVFSNDRYPRAFLPDLSGKKASDPDGDTLETQVGKGASLGANASITAGVRIGEFAMLGMGSVLTKSLPAYQLWSGVPARPQKWVCRCGIPLAAIAAAQDGEYRCTRCSLRYLLSSGSLTPID